jgi:hypothetical protein
MATIAWNLHELYVAKVLPKRKALTAAYCIDCIALALLDSQWRMENKLKNFQTKSYAVLVISHSCRWLIDDESYGRHGMKWSNIQSLTDEDVNCLIKQTAAVRCSHRDIFAMVECRYPICNC